MGKYDKRAKLLVIIATIFVALIIAVPITKYIYTKETEPVCKLPMKAEANFIEYENQVVKGATVQTLLNSYADCNVAVEVVTDNGDYWYYYLDETLTKKSSLDVSSAFKVNNENYINPAKEYYVTLTKDKDDNVVVVSFTQLEDDNAN